MVELQALQAGLAGLDQMRPAAAAGIGALAHAAVRLGRQHEFVPGHAGILQGLAGDLLGQAVGIDVGGVEEVDPGIERPGDKAVGVGLAEIADLAPDVAAAAERHGSETELGDEQAGRAEFLHVHGTRSCVSTRATRQDRRRSTAA
jgi:hypothetical protein